MLLVLLAWGRGLGYGLRKDLRSGLPGETYYYELEQNLDHLQLEDGSGNYLLEDAP